MIGEIRYHSIIRENLLIIGPPVKTDDGELVAALRAPYDWYWSRTKIINRVLMVQTKNLYPEWPFRVRR